MVIAPSFADIFFNNCYKIGLLPIVLSEAAVDRLFMETASFPGFELIINLQEQTVATTDNSISHSFEIDATRRHNLLNGLDEIALTLARSDLIKAYESRRHASQPWLA